MKKPTQSGFTLIELLVVIAIIGILASVVLSSLTTARDKSADAKIKAELANARAQSQTYFDSYNAYFDAGDTDPNWQSVCQDTDGIYNILSSAATTAIAAVVINGNQVATGNANCNAYTDAWVAQVPLKQLNLLSSTSEVDYYCVDSTGASKIVDQPLADFTLDEEVDPAVAAPLACL